MEENPKSKNQNEVLNSHERRKTANGKRPKQELNIIQAIELAISHELEARKSYVALANESDDPELKRLLREIAAEEAGHEATLQEPPAPL